MTTTRLGRGRLLLGIPAACILALTGWLIVHLDGPRRDVAVPPTDATPAEVVSAYVDALDAHDFDTARTLLTPPARRNAEPWFDAVDTLTNLHVLGAHPRGPGFRVDVAVEFDVTWRWLHDDGSMPEGTNPWGFRLERETEGDPWRIFDQGLG